MTNIILNYLKSCEDVCNYFEDFYIITNENFKEHFEILKKKSLLPCFITEPFQLEDKAIYLCGNLYTPTGKIIKFFGIDKYYRRINWTFEEVQE